MSDCLLPVRRRRPVAGALAMLLSLSVAIPSAARAVGAPALATLRSPRVSLTSVPQSAHTPERTGLDTIPATRTSPSVPDSLASVTTDTGALAPGPTSFTRFTVPGLCAALSHYTTRVEQRSVAAQAVLDTIRTTAPTRDTLPAAAITVAQRCGARFTVAGTPSAELTDLFTLALLANNDTLARAVVARQLALAPTTAARAQVLRAALGDYLAAAPARVAAAAAVEAQLGAQGAAAQALRFTVHDSLLAFASTTYDTAGMRREAERLIALGHEIPMNTLKADYTPLVRAYRALTALAFVAHPESLTTVAQRAKQDLGRFPPAPFPGAPDYQTMSLEKMLQTLSPLGVGNGPGFEATAVGQAPAPLQATYWYPKPAHWPPGNGPVSLVVYAGHGPCLGGFSGWASYNGACGLSGIGAGVYAAIARYAARGVPVTIVLETWPTAQGLLPSAVQAKADSVRWYYQTHLHLPVTVAVVADSMYQLPAPDGRRFPCNAEAWYFCKDRSPNAQRYLSEARPVLLLGRDGQFLYSGHFEYAEGHPHFDPLFEALLHHLLSASAITPSTTPSTGASGRAPSADTPSAPPSTASSSTGGSNVTR